MDPYIGEIRVFSFTFAPIGWAQCNGQVIPIAQNTALFSVIGTIYGGDGRSTFALPNLQSRIPIQFGQGAGLSDYSQGDSGGVTSVSLDQSQMPSHTHTLVASDSIANSSNPKGAFLAMSTPSRAYTKIGAPNALAPQALTPVGGSQPHSNLMPSLTMNFCISLQGVYPARSNL